MFQVLDIDHERHHRGCHFRILPIATNGRTLKANWRVILNGQLFLRPALIMIHASDLKSLSSMLWLQRRRYCYDFYDVVMWQVFI